MSEPRIKGRPFQPAVALLSTMDEQQLESHLSREAIQLVQSKIDPMAWYPAPVVRELMEYFWNDCLGKRSELALAGGQRLAHEMLESGRYQQLDSARAMSLPSSMTEALWVAKTIGTAPLLLYNFLEIDAKPTPLTDSTLALVYSNIEFFGEIDLWAGAGFIQQVLDWMGPGCHVAASMNADAVTYTICFPNLSDES